MNYSLAGKSYHMITLYPKYCDFTLQSLLRAQKISAYSHFQVVKRVFYLPEYEVMVIRVGGCMWVDSMFLSHESVFKLKEVFCL